MNKEFDPYNFDYKLYFVEMYNLTEMPAKLPRNTPFRLDDYAINNYEGMRIEKNDTFIKLYNNGFYRVFYNKDNDNIETYSLLNKDNPHICAEHVFRRISNPIKGIENINMWNSKYYTGIIRMWFRDEIIPKEPVIISDKIQSDKGFKFWLSLFDDYVMDKKSHVLLIISYKTGEEIKNVVNKTEIDNYYGDNKSNFRFVLKKK